MTAKKDLTSLTDSQIDAANYTLMKEKEKIRAQQAELQAEADRRAFAKKLEGFTSAEIEALQAVSVAGVESEESVSEPGE